MAMPRELVIGGILGVIGAWFGFSIGSGVETSWHAILLGVGICFFGLAYLASQVIPIPHVHFGELFFGALVGLAAEVFVIRSQVLAILSGAIGGASIAYLRMHPDRRLIELKKRLVDELRIVLRILSFLIVGVALLWAFPRGILLEVAIVSVVFLVLALALIGWVGNAGDPSG